MAKNKFSKNWMHEHLTDPYVRLAQKHNYRSRAAFKLTEIDEQERLIRPGMTIVDLGSAPGSWSQVLRERLARPGNNGLDGRVIALDLLPMQPVADVEFIEGDFRDDAVLEELESRLEGRKVDLVVSDMAPNLSGVAMADSAAVALVVELAVDFAGRHLKPNGALLVKCFHGSGYSQLVELFKRTFRVVSVRKPKASRDKSAETFLVGRGLKAPA